MAPPLEEGRGTEDVVFDDSGVSDITSSSNNSAGHAPSERSSGHMTSSESACSMASADDLSTSEKWAQVWERDSLLTGVPSVYMSCLPS